MIDLPIYMHLIFSFFATVGFSVFLNAPKSALLPAGITGAIGWTLYIILFRATYNGIFANFVAAAVVSLLSEILARKLKQPAILFVIPGIIPLVPGLGMYNTMLYLVQNHFDLAMSTGADTLFISGAIALGVLIMSSLSRTLTILQIRKKAAK